MDNYTKNTISREVLEHIKDESTDGPYLLETITTRKILGSFNPHFDEDAMCDCGHPYYRHFDPYEDYAPVGCKYCGCGLWTKPPKKAGLIPFIVNPDGSFEMLFMISSDANYGGPDPQISKGHVDPDDDGSFAAALREGAEELGLRPQNAVPHFYHPNYKHHERDDGFNHMDSRTFGFKIFSGVHRGSEGEYTINIYAIEVKSKIDFVKPGFETSHTEWMTLADFESRGREMQRYLVKQAAEKIDKYITDKSTSCNQTYDSGFIPELDVHDYQHK